MKKREIVVSSILMSLLLAGCQKNDPVSVDNVADSVAKDEVVVDESEVIEENVINEFVEPTAKVEFVQELSGSEIITLSENRIFVVNDENSVIYDENLNVVKEVGNIVPYIDFENSFNGMFLYKEPYFHDGKMKQKYGLMDFNGEILYAAQYMGDSFPNLEEDYESDYVDELYDTVTAMGGYDEEWMTTPTEPETSEAFKENGQWGIVGLDGNVILEPEYGGVTFSHTNHVDGLDYYKVTTEAGRVGIANNNGWVIEPSFAYEDSIYIVGNYTIVSKKSEKDKSYVYENKTANIIKELDFSIKNATLLTNSDNSNIKSNIVGLTSTSDKNYLFDSNFDEIILPEEIRGNLYYSAAGENLIAVNTYDDLYIVDAQGNLIYAFETDEYLFFGNQYIIADMVAYKISE